MPQVTVYIREGDIEAWRGISYKSEFIHNALQDRSTYDGAKITLREDLQDEPTYEKVPAIKEATAPPEPAPKLKVMTNSDLQALLGGKATPIKDEPRHVCKDNCKHWVWDTNSGKYTNSFTGEMRDAPEF